MEREEQGSVRFEGICVPRQMALDQVDEHRRDPIALRPRREDRIHGQPFGVRQMMEDGLRFHGGAVRETDRQDSASRRSRASAGRTPSPVDGGADAHS